MSLLKYSWNPRWQGEEGEDQSINGILLADSQEQILATRDYYAKERGFPIAEIPIRNGIIEGLKRIDSYRVVRANACLDINQWINIAVQEDFTFCVNANAFDSFLEEARNIETLRKGSLYKWGTGIYLPGTYYYLPERVMLALKYTDFKVYKKEAHKMQEDRRNLLARMFQASGGALESLDGFIRGIFRRK